MSDKMSEKGFVALRVYRVPVAEMEKAGLPYRLGVKAVISARYIPAVDSSIPARSARPAEYELLCEAPQAEPPHEPERPFVPTTETCGKWYSRDGFSDWETCKKHPGHKSPCGPKE